MYICNFLIAEHEVVFIESNYRNMNKFYLVILSFYFISNVKSQTADFTFETNDGLFCNPSTILFKQICTGNPTGFIWDFGNGQYGNKSVESITFSNAGSYTVKLIAVFKKNTLTISKKIIINPVAKAFIAFDKNFICQPGAINFTGSGTGNIINYQWNFGDNTPVVNTSSNTISHSFTNFGSNNVSLTTTANSGCSGTANTIITIKNLPVTGYVSPQYGCVPAVVNFTGNVILPVNSSVTSYSWNFGDGSPPYISTVNTASHVYSLVGQYFPVLTVSTSLGCSVSYNFTRLYFGTPPINHIAYAKKNPICGSDTAVFVTKATNANRYFWDFGDGTTASSTDTFIIHKYNTIGNKIVQVKPYYNECEAPSITLPFSVVGVIAKYTFSNNCSNKNTYTITDNSNGISTNKLWNFGDGVQLANVSNTVHSFPIPGQFKTTFSLLDTVTGCADITYRIIYTANPSLYSIDSALCKSTTVTVSILDNYINPSAMYIWNVAGSQIGPVAKPSITVKADTLGNFYNFVVINNGAGNCPDTINLKRPFIVKGPKLNFTVPSAICLSTPLIVTNNSQLPQAADSVKTWYWNLGNSNMNDTIFQPSPVQYTNPGSYDLKLTAIDINGCLNSLTKTITINPIPFLHIMSANDTLCYGQPVTMMAFHTNSILWSPANNISCANCDTISVKPLVSSEYYCTATNSFGCSAADTNYIEVSIPFTATVSRGNVYICQKESTTVTVNPKGKKILWSPATGLSDATVYNPVIAPMQNTAYTATVTDSTGCLTNSSKVLVKIYVKSLPFVVVGPDKYYSLATWYSFTPTYSSNVISYLWTPATLLNCHDCAVPQGIANYTQQYILKVTSDSGCVATDSVTIFEKYSGVTIFIPTAFSPNNDNLNDLFYPITRGVKSIKKFIIYNRQGKVVYEALNFPPNNKLYGWDGRFKGALQETDTYVYTIEAINEIGENYFKKGSVLLVR